MNSNIERFTEAKNRELGKIYVNKYGTKFKIIEYINSSNVTVKELNNNIIIKNIQMENLRRGSIMSPYDKTAYGVGFIGKGKYKIRDENNIVTKAYVAWGGIIERCYSKKYQEKRNTYIGCEVCEEWHNYQNFCEWFYDNYYEIENETMCLDKDILHKGNKIYSPTTCVFVTREINNLFIKSNKKRGECPIGVSYDKNRNLYSSNYRINNKLVYIGRFKNCEDAFYAYKENKESYIKSVANNEKYKNNIPINLYNALINYKVDITD